MVRLSFSHFYKQFYDNEPSFAKNQVYNERNNHGTPA